ncbi:transcription elongation factor TFIIS/CRSP70 [Tanacetum coccineum]
MGSMEDSKNVWKNYLQNKKANIFDIIKMSIMIAAYDHPLEFHARRDKILETLYSCELINCSGCDNCSKPNMIDVNQENDETKLIGEVLRIKEILEKSGHQSGCEPRMCVSLKKLQRMVLSVKTLQETGIGKTVKALQKHVSEDVSQIARELVKKWKALVDESLRNQSDAVKPTSDEKKGELTDSEGAGSIEDKNEATKKKLQQRKSVKKLEKKSDLIDSDGGSCTTEEKFEATKKKLHEGYSEYMTNKRKIQVMDVQEITKQGVVPQNSEEIKPGKKNLRRIYGGLRTLYSLEARLGKSIEHVGSALALLPSVKA